MRKCNHTLFLCIDCGLKTLGGVCVCFWLGKCERDMRHFKQLSQPPLPNSIDKYVQRAGMEFFCVMTLILYIKCFLVSKGIDHHFFFLVNTVESCWRKLTPLYLINFIQKKKILCLEMYINPSFITCTHQPIFPKLRMSAMALGDGHWFHEENKFTCTHRSLE